MITLCNFININSLCWDSTGLLRDGFLEHALKGRAYRAFYFVNMGVSAISIVNSIINNTQNKIKSLYTLSPKILQISSILVNKFTSSNLCLGPSSLVPATK